MKTALTSLLALLTFRQSCLPEHPTPHMNNYSYRCSRPGTHASS
jgi:hypothetical protein